ncbi:MAG: disulfide bond formation protein B [Rhodospirillales bacterium]|nr:disulfide bond formation protein B [Rhodospirillales bacterium]
MKSITGFAHLLLTTPLIIFSGLVFVALLSLGAAYTTQYGFGLQPCILCLFQRVPYALIILLGGTGLWAIKTGKAPALIPALVFASSFVFLCGGIIASYHVGVEQHWWTSFLEGCRGGAFSGDAKDILAQIESTPSVPCDRIPWEMFGISMAGYNALLSMGFAIGCGLSGWLLLNAKKL